MNPVGRFVFVRSSITKDVNKKDGGGVTSTWRFVNDERALWWHHKTKHDLTHTNAMNEVEAERNALSVILNGGLVTTRRTDVGSDKKKYQKKKKDPGDLQRAIRAAKNGDLGEEFEKCILEKKVARLPFHSLEYSRRGDIDALRKCTEDVKTCLDSNGASCLHWASFG